MAKTTLPGEKVIVRARESLWFAWPKMLFSLTLYFWWWRRKFLQVTNQRVIYCSGLLSRTERSVALENVLDVAMRRGIGGRVFGYGTIIIETAATGRAEFAMVGVRQPSRLRDAIFEARAAYKALQEDHQRQQMAQMLAQAQAQAMTAMQSSLGHTTAGEVEPPAK